MFRKTWQGTALWLGIGWGLLYAIILSNLPLIKKTELNIQDRLLRLHQAKVIPPEILLVNINKSDYFKINPGREFYADLVNHLLEAEASVVVLNLQDSWRNTPDFDYSLQETQKINNPLRELVQNHADRIVLVTRTNSLSNSESPEFPIYNHFLPFQTQSELEIAPETVQGFFEYEAEAENPTNITSSARQVHLLGNFTLKEQISQQKEFKSAILLALEKFNLLEANSIINKQPPFDRANPQALSEQYLPSSKNLLPLQAESFQSLAKTPIQINFWGKTNTFPRLSLQSICILARTNQCHLPINNQIEQVRHKIVLIGFTGEKNLNTMPSQSPFGDSMPAVELQANLLASLMTNSFYQTPSQWQQVLIIIFGAVLVSSTIVLRMTNSREECLKYGRYWLWLILSLIGGYSGLSIILFWHQLMLPLIVPLLTWSATGASVFICMALGLQKDLIAQQQSEIIQLKAAEQEAVLLMTKKLLQRTASDIHDLSLQQLKVVMDKIELEANLDADFILDNLEAIGHDIRQQLNNIRHLAQKLEITKELRQGLDVGIKSKLQQLIDSQKLTLLVIQDLHPLPEPNNNSKWIEAREEIYQFFKEAITNVIYHAQPPNGTATQVSIRLYYNRNHAILEIENDGSFSCQPTPKRTKGGYGTKMMETIATELPEGAWERVSKADGGMRVKLVWNHLLF